MKKYGQKYKRTCICFALLFALLLSVHTQAGAAVEHIIRILIHDAENNTLSYAIDSNYAAGDAILFSAAYSGNQMSELHTEAAAVDTEASEKTQIIAADYDDAKVFLFDAETFEPLSKPGQKVQASFVDYDGTALSQQTLWSGHCVSNPGIPTRAGYYFSEWDKPLSALYEDTVYTAAYIENTSPNIFMISSVQGVKGQEITVSVNLMGTVKTCGFDMALSYDGDALEFQSLDAEWVMDVVANHVAEESRIYFNYSAKENRTTGGKVMEITFKVRDTAAENTTLELIPASVLCTDNQDALKLLNANYTAVKGVVYIQ